MEILIADNDVLVEIFDLLYHANRVDFNKIVFYLQSRYSRIWIPRTVIREFTITPRREKQFFRLRRTFPNFIEECPVHISPGEIDLLISARSGIHEGEADGIQQAKKAEMLPRYLQGFIFFSRDRNALRRAGEFGLDTLDFENLRTTVKEAGIVL
jgi:hypothetical protein